MNYDRLKRCAVVRIGDADVSVSFSLSALEKLENNVFTNLITFADSGKVPTMTQLVEAFKIGYEDANPDKGDAEEKALQLMHEKGLPELMKAFYIALGASGVLGPEGSEAVMKSFGVESRDPKPKNARAEKPAKK